ncbi:MAG: hypothetical protein P4L36_04390 [Holophaga sp.]|nr:hypothetical protein [Holophaga sp.]
MMMLGPRIKHASMVWLEPYRVHAGGQFHAFPGAPAGEDLTRVLESLPMGPTHWVVDDTWAPTLLLRDIVEIPAGTEPREAFFRWRYSQDLLLETPQFVQALALEEGSWLLSGVPQALRDAWIQAATAAGRPMRRLQPRWLWLYNRMAANQTVPGMLLSLCLQDQGRYTGTLAAWGHNLTLLRQWTEPAEAEVWCQERVLPTIAYLQRESRSPQEIHLWGAGQWPDCGLPVRLIQPEIPAQEVL